MLAVTHVTSADQDQLAHVMVCTVCYLVCSYFDIFAKIDEKVCSD
jgi:hypothetical protein